MKSFSGTTNFATTAVWATKQVIGDTPRARRPLVTTTAGMPTPHIILPSIRGNAPNYPGSKLAFWHIVLVSRVGYPRVKARLTWGNGQRERGVNTSGFFVLPVDNRGCRRWSADHQLQIIPFGHSESPSSIIDESTTSVPEVPTINVPGDVTASGTTS